MKGFSGFVFPRMRVVAMAVAMCCAMAVADAAPAPAKGDFNGDGKSDILWRHAGNGQNWMWLMNGASPSSIVNFNTVADLGWTVAAKGDFNGDGKADIFWRKTSTNETYVYLMNGSSIASHANLNPVSSVWAVVGAGDLNGDGREDIVWRNSSTGENYVWLMYGTASPIVLHINTVADLGWQIHAIGDFNGDGKADIFWRKASTHETYVYLMNGSSIASSSSMQPVSSTRYMVAGTGDLNGDGKGDIVWRDQTNGENYVWLMNGTASPSVQLINAVADQAWKIEGIGDYNGDGKADLFWRKSTTSGENWLYLMNGSSITSSTSVAPVVHIDYKVVPYSTLVPSITLTGKLNDTGIVTCGAPSTAATQSNSLACTDPAAATPAQQDGKNGRDDAAQQGTLTKVGGSTPNNGKATGFDFTKIGSNGQPLAIQNGTWSAGGSEAAGTKWDCVRDNVTGLLWENKSDDNGLRDNDWIYTWYNSNPATNGGNAGSASGTKYCYQSGRCDTEKFVADVNAAGLCGYTDWRMPTVEELQGIAYLGRFPAIDSGYFPSIPSNFNVYWSGSPDAADSDLARCIAASGESRSYKNDYFPVRLVRGQ